MTRQELVATSRGRDWPAIQVDHRRIRDAELEQRPIAEDLVVLNVGPPLFADPRSAGWSDASPSAAGATMDTDTITVVPARSHVVWRSSGVADMVVVTLGPAAAARSVPGGRPGVLRTAVGVDDPFVRSALLTLLREASSPPPDSAAFVAALSGALTVHLGRTYPAEPRRVGASEQSARTLVTRVEQFVADNPTAPLSLDHLARVASVSSRHLARLFRRATGTTVHEFVLRSRLDRARRLLLDGYSVDRAAHDAGFADGGHLARHTRQRWGLRPRELRSRPADRP